MIKTILVAVTGTASDDTSFPAALGIARAHSAHLEFLHVRQDVGRTIAAFGDVGTGGVTPDLLASLEQAETEREIEAKRKVEEFCAREHVSMATSASPPLQAVSARWSSELGDPAAWLSHYGQTAELTVVGRGDGDDAGTLELLEAALVDSGRPVYIPGPVPVPAETVAIAWKPTREAARAVAAAGPFLAKAKRVVVLTVAETATGERASAARLVEALQRHHLTVEARDLAPDGQRPVDRLLLTATALSAGLLVMGGYGHSRLREWVFGGFTQRVIDGAPLPVLMSH